MKTDEPPYGSRTFIERMHCALGARIGILKENQLLHPHWHCSHKLEGARHNSFALSKNMCGTCSEALWVYPFLAISNLSHNDLQLNYTKAAIIQNQWSNRGEALNIFTITVTNAVLFFPFQ